MAKYWSDLQPEKKHLILAWALLLIFMSPPFILGEDAHIRVHDNMDSNIAWYNVLKESGQLFGPMDSVIPQIINGLPRNAFGTEFSLIQWFHNWFSSMTAYALSQAVTRIFAFLGMYLLLKKHILPDKKAYPVSVWVSVAFALTPFWPSGMLSTLGQPLALWAFLTIRKHEDTWKEWLTLILLPLYSSFVLGFFFFLSALGVFWLWELVTKKRWNLRFLGSIALMTAIYLLIEYRLVYSLIVPQAPTSRDEFQISTLAFLRSVQLVFKNFLLGHTHDMTVHTVVILPVLFVALYKSWGRKKDEKQVKLFQFLFLLNVFLSVWYAFWFYKGWVPIKDHFHFLATFNFARYHFLRPLVIYVLFALGIWMLWDKEKWRTWIRAGLMLQVFILCCFNEEIYYRFWQTPSFKQFYAEKQFQQIESYIGEPQSTYRVASLGIHPAIAQYNGFYTLDTYNNYYPLSYKHEFRKIIQKELEKSPKLAAYYDDWGNRCYLFSAELGKRYNYTKNSKKRIKHLQLNTTVFTRMGGEYILSAVPIVNTKENNLQYIRKFTQRDSAWTIYLYRAVKEDQL
ncbi:DUF6044 family protein [Fictibacillus enclensis]|uniref:DUF6044 family protein n=1 Tax=Fictibacillus enclensis TaxID=1017270 RepID=UPI0025A1B488|nr:DUF6044 family protein [Fictibacillus enclensis]MDM5339998.1 DUF6044 family protein [Fictibacillus enclensis]